MRTAVSTDGAPKAIGPYSQAIRAGSLLFLSGQIPIDPATGQMVDGDITQQTQRVFKNLEAILTAAGASFDNVVRTTVYLADMGDFAAMNEVYAAHVGEAPPARSTVEVAKLPSGALVEIEAVALL
jgi:2-iminobutanoate/2-iminopropanoate deaminase